MPRTYTETVTVYTYEELDERAKERARDWYRSYDTDWNWAAEYRSTLEAGLRLLGARAKDWQVDHGGGWITLASLPDDPNEEQRWYQYGGKDPAPMEGARLARWISREYGKELGGCCALTGFCADEDLLDPIRKFLKRPRRGITWNELVQACADAWIASAARDMEFQASDESVAETIIVNQYEFLETGEKA